MLMFSLCRAQNREQKNQKINLNELSEQFLERIQKGEDTQEIQYQLATLDMEVLVASLETDPQKLAFWVNTYNAFIQIILTDNPDLYENRNSFFSKDQITIARNEISFDKIEHGILRRSKSKLGLGYVNKGFPDKFERALRVKKPDYRIHFALNCGAKDCPPVAIYAPEQLEAQFAKSTSLFLKQSSTFDPDEKEVYVTSLFSWFRGDFGGKDGTRAILKKNGIIPTVEGIGLEYKSYDWTLKLNNFIEL